MTLNERLKSTKEKAVAFLGDERWAVMKAHNEELVASNYRDNMLQVGDSAPKFALPDQHGNMVYSRGLLKKAPLVVSFYRGQWCPYCNGELAFLRDAYPRFEEAGIQLVAVSPMLPEYCVETAKKRRIPFPLLSDKGNELAKHYGIVFICPPELKAIYQTIDSDLALFNGDDSWMLPMPTRVVIDQENIIRSIHISPDYTDRPEPEETLEEAKKWLD